VSIVARTEKNGNNRSEKREVKREKTNTGAIAPKLFLNEAN